MRVPDRSTSSLAGRDAAPLHPGRRERLAVIARTTALAGLAIAVAACGGAAPTTPLTGIAGSAAGSSAAAPVTTPADGAGSIGGASAAGGADAGASATSAPSPAPVGSPTATTVSTAALPAGAPWAAWRPTGHGTVTSFRLPAPWTGGTRSYLSMAVYLPAGYATSGRSYPVVYEVPFPFDSYQQQIHVQALLDAQIASGAVPASIVVFVPQVGGPFRHTECVDAANGTEWYETFVTASVVPYVDAHYRTLATPAARAVMGWSEGGFCAAMLALRHPEVFSTALAITGYYQAGIRSRETPDAWRVFDGRAADEAAYSPLRLVGRLGASQRSRLLLVLEANPAQPFYGPQYRAMLAAARAAGVATVGLPVPQNHSWQLVGRVLPSMLRTLGRHEHALGVFGG